MYSWISVLSPLQIKKMIIIIGNFAVFLLLSFVFEVSGLLFAPETQSVTLFVTIIGFAMFIETIFLVMLSDPESRIVHIVAILALGELFSLFSFQLVGYNSPIFENYDATHVSSRLMLWIVGFVAGLMGKGIGKRRFNTPPLRVQA